MASKIRDMIRNAALLAAALLFSIAGAELGLRFFRPQPLEAAYVWEDGTLRHLPSFSFTYTRQEFSNAVRFNSLGLRGGEIERAKAAGGTRVLVLGDSFVEGKQVAEGDLFTARLSELWSASGCRAEVINAGVSGYGTSDEIHLWRSLGKTLRPDVVLLGFYPNDVRNNADRGIFDLKDGRAVQTRRPSLPNVRWIYDVRKFLTSRSHLYMLFKLGLEAMTEEDAVSRRESRRAKGGSTGEGSGEKAGGGAGGTGDGIAFIGADPLEAEEVFALEPTPKVSAGWDLTLALLDLLKAEVESTGARFAVAVLPTRFQVDNALWTKQSARIGVDPGDFDLRKPQSVLAGWGMRTETPVFDLLEAFRARNLSNTFYFDIDAHWRPEGHRLAAETIAGYFDVCEKDPSQSSGGASARKAEILSR